jgi:hypothetical protein
LARGHLVVSAVGAPQQPAGKVVLAGARSEHGLQEIGARLPRIELDHAPGNAQHLAILARLAEGRGVFTEQAEVAWGLVHRLVEPRPCRTHPHRVAQQLAAKLERAGVGRIDLERAVGRGDGEVVLAVAVAEAADVDPQARVLRASREGHVEGVPGGGDVAVERFKQGERVEPALGAACVELALPEPAARSGNVVLQQFRLAGEGRDLFTREAGFERAVGSDFGSDAVTPIERFGRIGKRISTRRRHRGRDQRQDRGRGKDQAPVRPAGHTS